MGFVHLPKDLKNIVCSFAYDCSWGIVEENLKQCGTVKAMQIHPVFTRQTMWSLKYQEYLPSPLIRFEPIQNFSHNWQDYIDWHAVQELLWRLDFRRKFVKLVHSRREWRKLFKENWANIVLFDGFYRFLLYTRVPCFKPLWKPCGFNHLKSYRSPFVSARWWLSGLMP
jgi:hypothetical protein